MAIESTRVSHCESQAKLEAVSSRRMGTLRLVVLLLCMIGVTTGNLFNSVEREMKLTDGYGKPVCILDYTLVECYPEIRSPATLARPGTLCSRYDMDGFLQCQEDGSWRDITDQMKQYYDFKTIEKYNRRRKKRFLGFLIGAIIGAVVGTTVGVVACHYLCDRGGGVVVVPNAPPEIICPTVNTLRPETGTSMIVRWTEPIGQDKEDGQITNVRRSGLAPESEFDEGDHTITYHVTDSQGFPASCQVFVRIKPFYCSDLPWPPHGRSRSCTYRYVSGSSCTLECHKGYEISDSNSVKCDKEMWTGDIPKCEAKFCDAAPTVDNGTLTCHGDTVYGTYCILTCTEGYTTDGKTTTICTDTGQWSESGTCIDSSPPVFTSGCPDDITDYAEKKDQPTKVTWTDPEVTDNSGASLTVTSNPTKESLFTLGQTTVSVTVTDTEGNSAKCTFHVNINSLYCPAPDFGDEKLMYDCPDGHGYGYSCTLSCHSGYPLKGSSTVLCDMGSSGSPVWTWPDDSIEPFCRVTTCPDLTVPLNGALACDAWTNGPMCIMKCNEDYDVSRSVADQYTCGEQSGSWFPNDIVYDCTVKRRAGVMMLPSEFYYYSGSCHNETTQREIAENFVHILNTSEGFDGICGASVPECRPELVDVICGETTRKKRDVYKIQTVGITELVDVISGETARKKRDVYRRQTVGTRIEFMVFVPFEEEPGEDLQAARSRVENTLYSYIDAVDQLLSDGELDQENYDVTAQADSYYPGVPDFYCPEGVPSYNTGSCRGCSVGTYTEGDDCIDCPVGTYNDEDFASICKSCGEGRSTKTTMSKSADNCTELCPPGSYSQDGMLPCTPCDPGYYQNDSGMISCRTCSATTTSQQGSDDVTDCVAYDVKISANTETDLGELISDLTSLTLTYWFRVDTSADNTISVLKDPQGNSILGVTVTGTVFVNINGNMIDTTVSPASDRWQHLTLTLDGSTKVMKVYLNGNEEFTDTLSSLTDPVVPQESTMTSVATSGEIMLSGIIVMDRVISIVEVQTSSGTCLKFNEDSVFLVSRSGQKLVVPSLCDAEDDCAASPCGSHPCEDEIGGFTCDCQDGSTGTTCDIPPDYCANHECQNSATCENGNNNYVCRCLKGFRGDLCEEVVVNGQWSGWTQWTQCSQTCGSGSRTRRRECNSPPPDDDGDDCVGDTEEISWCNPESCPECTPLKLSIGNVKSCLQVEDLQLERCNVTCRHGLVFNDVDAGLVLPVYECGAITDYVWNHQEHDPKARPPPCTEPDAAISYTGVTDVSYSNLPCQVAEQAQQEVLSQVSKATSDLPCVKDSLCSASSSLSPCDQSTFRKRSVIPALIQITIVAQMTSDLSADIQVFAYNGTVTNNLQDFVSLVLNTDLSIQMLVNNSETNLQLTIGGTTYYIDPDTMTTIAIIDCPDGTVPADGLCGKCPVGTRAEDNRCVLCEKGTFQDVAASTTCKPCPEGQTTLEIGSTQSSDCIDDDDGRNNPENHGDESLLLKILPVTIVGSLVLIAIILFLVWKIKSSKAFNFWIRLPRPSTFRFTRRVQVQPVTYENDPPPYTETWYTTRPVSPSSVEISPLAKKTFLVNSMDVKS